MTVESNQPKRLIFLHSKLDEAQLDPYEFRLLAHIARRGECFATLATTAKWCGMSVRKAQLSLKTLLNLGLVSKELRSGRSDIYKLADDLWEKLESKEFLTFKQEKEKKFQEKEKKKSARQQSRENQAEHEDG
jgi:Helix-turn-helix domain